MQTILVVDDNPLNLDVLVDLLSGYELLVSLNAQNALALLQENSVDLILLDIMMPDMDGIEMAKALKNNPQTASIPLLFITAKQDDESIEEGFNTGAVDYITKPFRPRELIARVKTHLHLSSVIKKLEFSAKHDYLSGAYNRRSFFHYARERFNDASIDKLYAVMIDIDKFKSVNDTYGHGVGDLVIKALSDTIHAHMDKEMLCARMGGEEFAILMSYDDENVVLNWVESLRMTIEQLEVFAEENTVHFSVSCGVACHGAEHKSIDALLDQADKSLYIAKETGRNKVIFRV
ncbi:MAG: diguanylate cyclase [Sulfurimonadaceae bacterium]